MPESSAAMPPDLASTPAPPPTRDEVAAVVLGAIRAVDADLSPNDGPRFYDLHVRVALAGGEATVHLRLAVRYGVRLPEVLPRLQTSIQEQLQATFGFAAVHLTIDVKDLYFDET